MPTLKKGFYHPTAIIILALITLSFALIFFINSKYFIPKKTPSPSPVASPQLTPSPKSSADDAASWKTYTNDKIGFSIKFPKDWKLDENNFVIYKGEKIETESPVDPYYAALAIYESSETTAQEACDRYDCGYQKLQPNSKFKIESVKTNNIAGLKVTTSDLNGSYYLASNGKVTRIHYGVITKRDQTLTEEEHKRNFETLEKIISTFQFLN